MDPNEIINNALSDAGLNGEGLFVLEGHPERNEFRILPADEIFKMNLNAFVWDINTGFQYLGVFTSEQLAQDLIDTIRMRLRDENGKRLI